MPNFEAQFGAQPNERLYANQLSEAVRRGKYMYWDRPGAFLALNCAAAIPVFPTAIAAQINQYTIPGAQFNNHLELYQTTAQTLIPSYNVKGLSVGGDLVDNEALEIVPGGNRTTNPFGYTAGTDPGVFFRVTLEITDVSGIDQFIIGWRLQEAYAVPASILTTGNPTYNSLCGLGFSTNPTTAAMIVKTMTDLNAGGSTVVASTLFSWADTKIHTLEVRLQKRKASYFINGAKLGNTISKDGIGAALTAQATTEPAAFTFDVGDFCIPFFFLRQDAGTSAAYIRRMEVGQLLEVGLAPGDRGPQTYYF